MVGKWLRRLDALTERIIDTDGKIGILATQGTIRSKTTAIQGILKCTVEAHVILVPPGVRCKQGIEIGSMRLTPTGKCTSKGLYIKFHCQY